jgi:hypothetical protein
MKRFKKPWIQKRPIQRGQIEQLAVVDRLCYFKLRSEAAQWAQGGRKKKTSCLMSAETKDVLGANSQKPSVNVWSYSNPGSY